MLTMKVLIVDDELGMRLATERALSGYRSEIADVNGEVEFVVEMAGTGEEGLEKIQAAPPDILLLDHKLPGISGLEVLEKLGQSRPDLLTIMITAYASLETAIIATKRGAYDFLAKPFTPGELKAAVRKAARHLVLSREAQRLAEEKKQVRFQFISVLAHELKAPLAAVQGYLYMFRDHALGDDLKDYEKVVDRSLIRLDGMRKMIMDLLDLTRIESGKKQREIQDVDLKEVAEMSIETMLPSAQEKGVKMTLDTQGGLVIPGDRGEFEIILNNLVSNAVKYNRDNGQVTVSIARIESLVTIAVTDTGIGMTPEECGRLFGEFVRIKNRKTSSILGSGLGLSIVKKLTALYDGDVSVTSEPDVGSTFTARLKVLKPGAAETSDS